MNKYDLLICDIDGTVVSKGTEILPITKNAIQAFVNKGTAFALASGRPIDTKNINKTKEWGFDFEPHFIIGMNGNELWYRDERIIHSVKSIKKEEVREILSYMWPLDTNIVIFADGYNKVLVKRYDDWSKRSQARNNSNILVSDFEDFCKYDVGKIEFHFDDSKKLEILETLDRHLSNKYAYTQTFFETLEIMPKGIDKGSALIEACNYFGFDINKVIACGDMDNDIPLLLEAGTSICLKNGSEKTKEVADYITDDSVEEDGLGKFLFKNFIN